MTRLLNNHKIVFQAANDVTTEIYQSNGITTETPRKHYTIIVHRRAATNEL